MAFVIGLTGGIGSGKTTVANLFADRGIDVIDADIIARQVVEPGTEGLAAIVDKFGTDILDAQGMLDRGKLRAHIFSTPDAKEWLNALLHPTIRLEMLRQTQQATSPYCMLVVPLLIENGLQSLCDRVLVVDVSEQTQIERTTQRDSVDETQVKNILNAQASRKERLSFADDVVENECSNEELNAQVAALHSQYVALAGKQRESS
ncbi:dephospho-CoA kinase [Enterovibrio norvegicus]|uniref:dephospho-CoA kinase n=1 Tax=Enterovibrio norvegicus TaxID=188144 RepID=UPI000C848246|nr:dephospho-CoA kinase [Enterovibrio norvegicus]PML77590.1 dephospho-CoA kinase [Enterovibrio norvegicus]